MPFATWCSAIGSISTAIEAASIWTSPVLIWMTSGTICHERIGCEAITNSLKKWQSSVLAHWEFVVMAPSFSSKELHLEEWISVFAESFFRPSPLLPFACRDLQKGASEEPSRPTFLLSVQICKLFCCQVQERNFLSWRSLLRREILIPASVVKIGFLSVIRHSTITQ